METVNEGLISCNLFEEFQVVIGSEVLFKE